MAQERTTAISNLRNYIRLTTVAKKVGGPVALIAITAVSGWAVGRGAEAGGRQVFNVTRRKLRNRDTPCDTKGQIFNVHSDGEFDGGLKLSTGDKYKVLERDHDAIQIEVLNDSNNPYFVSRDFLTTISDFPTDGETAGS